MPRRLTILIEAEGTRSWTELYEYETTRIPGIARIRYYRPLWIKRTKEYFSLVHENTGRAVNLHPLTMQESEQLIDALLESALDWAAIDEDNYRSYFPSGLTEEAERLAMKRRE